MEGRGRQGVREEGLREGGLGEGQETSVREVHQEVGGARGQTRDAEQRGGQGLF